MPTLSMDQIALHAQSAGLPNSQVAVATAVAMAESSGNSDVVNSIGCVGLWQINQPVHVKTHPLWTREWLKNPANNARAMVELSGHGIYWRPWEAYTNGNYQV